MVKLKSILFKLLNSLSGPLVKTGIHRKFPAIVSVYDFLFQHFWPYKNIIEVQGSKMYFDIHEKNLSMRRTFQAYASNRIHEEATTSLFKKIVKEGNIVIDLGANIGYFTLLAARLVKEKGKVFAFEPEPENYSYLIKNIKLNNYNNVVAIQKAVSNTNGKTKLFICPYDTGHHTINRFNGIEAYKKGRTIGKKDFIEIETITLDKFFDSKEKLIDVIKMDVEGAEMLALLGMDEILRKNQKLKMFVEFFPLLIKSMGNSPEEFIYKLLEDYKFSIFIIPDDYSAQKDHMVEIKDIREIMDVLEKEKDHVNLFLTKSNSQLIF